MHAPQIILIVLNAAGIGVCLAKKDGRELATTVVGTATLFGLLYWGGFFS